MGREREQVSGSLYTTIPQLWMVGEASGDTWGKGNEFEMPEKKLCVRGLDDLVEILPGCTLSMSWSLLQSGFFLWD